jgi:hypothetical protein
MRLLSPVIPLWKLVKVSKPVRKAHNLLREGDWNKELEGGLPDSRLRDPSKNLVYREGRFQDPDTKIVYRGRIAYEVAYCANCGKPEGLVTAEWAPHAFALCKECADKFGTLGLTEIPKEVVQGKKPLI